MLPAEGVSLRLCLLFAPLSAAQPFVQRIGRLYPDPVGSPCAEGVEAGRRRRSVAPTGPRSRAFASPGRVPPVQPFRVTENRAGRASRRSRRSGRRQSPPERCGGSHGDPWRAATPSWRAGPLHRPSRSLSRGRPMAPCKQDPLCLSPEDDLRAPCEGENLVPEVELWANASLPFLGENKRGLPLHRRDLVPGGWANPGPLRLSPHRGDAVLNNVKYPGEEPR